MNLLYWLRARIEPFISKPKRLEQMATRCEKTATNSAALAWLFALAKSLHRGWRVGYSGGRGALSCAFSRRLHAFHRSHIFSVTFRQPSD